MEWIHKICGEGKPSGCQSQQGFFPVNAKVNELKDKLGFYNRSYEEISTENEKIQVRHKYWGENRMTK